MAKLPKNFPEYSIMYKTLIKKIQELQQQKEGAIDKMIHDEIQEKINLFQNEIEKIKSKFPENFFKEKF